MTLRQAGSLEFDGNVGSIDADDPSQSPVWQWDGWLVRPGEAAGDPFADGQRDRFVEAKQNAS